MPKNDKCPICGYLIKPTYVGGGCQCLFTGSCHPDRYKKTGVVKDHLYLFSKVQVEHVLSLEKYWQTSYGDEERELIRKKLFNEYAKKPKRTIGAILRWNWRRWRERMRRKAK